MSILRAAIYLRQSRTAAAGIERQRERCSAMVDLRDWEFAGAFEDDDVSASKVRGPGTAWGQMISEIHAGRIDVVVAVDLDRLLRTTRDLLVLTEAGAKVITLDGEIDLTTADGEFRATILTSIARFEGRRKAERQIRANDQRARAGHFFSGGVRLTGYSLKGEVIESEAAIIREVFSRFAAGESLLGIARWLESEGVTPRRLPVQRGTDPGIRVLRDPKKWPPSSVRSILDNPRYAARVMLRGPEGKPDGWSTGVWVPLVDSDRFDVVQARLADPSRKTNRVGTARRYLGAGLWKCAVCDRSVSTAASRYQCSHGHGSRSIEQVDDYVRAIVRARLQQPDFVRAFLPSDDLAQRRLEKESELWRGRREKVETDYSTFLIEGRIYNQQVERIDAELTRIDNARIKLGLGAESAEILGASDPASAFESASIDRQRAVVNSLLTVRLHKGQRYSKAFDPDTVEIIWKTDESQPPIAR